MSPPPEGPAAEADDGAVVPDVLAAGLGLLSADVAVDQVVRGRWVD
jgi:hypothetical protein